MEQPKSHPFLALIVLLAAMALSAFGGYKYYEYRNVEQEDIEEIEEENKNLTEKEVKDIYDKKLPIMEWYGETPNIYQSSKKDINNMDLSFLRAFLYTKIEFKDGDIEPFPSEGTTYEVVGFEDLYNDGWFIFEPSLLQEQAKIYLGQEIENGDFAEHVGSGATFQNGKYYHSMGGASSIIPSHLREFISSEQKDDTLTIKDKYIVYYYDTSSFTYTVYNTSEQTTPVATFTLQQEMTDEEVKNHILSTYEVYLKEYTHTFKKDNNDNWYWISTEPSE